MFFRKIGQKKHTRKAATWKKASLQQLQNASVTCLPEKWACKHRPKMRDGHLHARPSRRGAEHWEANRSRRAARRTTSQRHRAGSSKGHRRRDDRRQSRWRWSWIGVEKGNEGSELRKDCKSPVGVPYILGQIILQNCFYFEVQLHGCPCLGHKHYLYILVLN